uniref:Uncharacterized protein n=1 Tax=Physcomitrium patens TaxID=3218 RepID=A0A2K1IPD7_PHYPA|nr:hypothetical protein PHYPA_027462 [Physcomitrium patens]
MVQLPPFQCHCSLIFSYAVGKSVDLYLTDSSSVVVVICGGNGASQNQFGGDGGEFCGAYLRLKELLSEKSNLNQNVWVLQGCLSMRHGT